MTQSPQNHSHSSPGDGGEHLKPKSVSTDKADTGNVHELDATESVSQAVTDNAGEVIDLAGQTFTVTSQIALGTEGTTLRNGTIVSDVGSSTSTITATADNVTVQDLTIDGNKANSGSNHVLDIANATNCTFANLSIENAGKHGIVIDTLQYSRFSNVDILNSAEKGMFYFSGNSIYNRHSNMDIRDCGGNGIEISSGKNMSFDQCDIRNCQYGARILSTVRISFNNCSFVHGSQFAGVLIRNSDYCSITGNSRVWSNVGDGLVLEGASQNLITATFGSNDFDNSGGNDINLLSSSTSDSVGNTVLGCSFDRKNGNVATAVNEVDSNQDYNTYDDLTFTSGYTTTVSKSGANSTIEATKQF